MAIAACLCVPAHARAGTLNGEISLASQLVDRGLAITPVTPVVQGSVSWTTQSGWSLGLSAGVEGRSPGDVAAGVARLTRAWSVSENWRMQAGIVYYRYAGLRHANVYEPGVYWIYRDVLVFGLSEIHVAGEDGHRFHPAADLSLRWPLSDDFSVSAGIGVAHYAVAYGYPEQYYSSYYRYGEVGLLWGRGPWQVRLDRIAVDPDARSHLHGLVASPWLVTISRSF